jgi:NTE family protein
VIGVLFNAVFLDNLEQDEIHMRRINHLLAAGGSEVPGRQYHVEIEVVRPSANLGAIAHEFEPRLPRAFRFLTRRLGTRTQTSPDLVSMLMFQNDYLCRLIELGEADTRKQARDIARLIEG